MQHMILDAIEGHWRGRRHGGIDGDLEGRRCIVELGGPTQIQGRLARRGDGATGVCCTGSLATGGRALLGGAALVCVVSSSLDLRSDLA